MGRPRLERRKLNFPFSSLRECRDGITARPPLPGFRFHVGTLPRVSTMSYKPLAAPRLGELRRCSLYADPWSSVVWCGLYRIAESLPDRLSPSPGKGRPVLSPWWKPWGRGVLSNGNPGRGGTIIQTRIDHRNRFRVDPEMPCIRHQMSERGDALLGSRYTPRLSKRPTG